MCLLLLIILASFRLCLNLESLVGNEAGTKTDLLEVVKQLAGLLKKWGSYLKIL